MFVAATLACTFCNFRTCGVPHVSQSPEFLANSGVLPSGYPYWVCSVLTTPSTSLKSQTCQVTRSAVSRCLWQRILHFRRPSRGKVAFALLDMDESTKSTVAKIPLLSVRAGPRDEAWKARLREELTVLIKYVEINKEQDKDWFRIECNPHGTRWTGKCWYYFDQLRYEFDLEFDIPVTYPTSAPELKLPQLDGKTSKMYRGGKICQTVHFQPLWARNIPHFGIAHSLALSVSTVLRSLLCSTHPSGQIRPCEHIDTSMIGCEAFSCTLALLQTRVDVSGALHLLVHTDELYWEWVCRICLSFFSAAWAVASR